MSQLSTEAELHMNRHLTAKKEETMLDQVREAFKSIDIPKPDAEEKEILDRLREFSEELKSGTGGTDSDTSPFESAHLTPEPKMTDGMPESTIETVIRCPIDDPTPPAICDPIDIGWDFA